MFYLLACRDCGDPGDLLPVPFGSPADRGRWASAHTRATGHDRWLVRDEQAADLDEALAAFDDAAAPAEVVPREITVEYRHEGGEVIATSPQLPGLQVARRDLDEARRAMHDLLAPLLDLGVTIADGSVSA